MLTTSVWIILLWATAPAHAQDAPILTEASEASVITILPGDPLYSSFGHTAIRIRDDSTGIDVGYNYGTFDFEEEDFYLKFLEGKLDYYLDRSHFEDVFYAYRMEQRPVLAQRLNFTLAERQELFDRLETNYLPENRGYRYEFLYDNCSTRPRDMIESVWDYRMSGSEAADDSSFRNLIDRYLADKPWTRFGIDIVLGARTDATATPRQRMFLPDEFLAAVETAHTPDGLPLSAPTDTLFWPQGYERWTGALPWPSILGWILLVAIAAVSLLKSERDRVRRFLHLFDGVLFLVLGIVGIVIVLLWFATEHTVTKANWNLLWALPTHTWLGIRLLGQGRLDGIAWYFWPTLALIAVVAVGWTWIPQEFNPWLVPYLGVVSLRAAVHVRELRV